MLLQKMISVVSSRLHFPLAQWRNTFIAGWKPYSTSEENTTEIVRLANGEPLGTANNLQMQMLSDLAVHLWEITLQINNVLQDYALQQ